MQIIRWDMKQKEHREDFPNPKMSFVYYADQGLSRMAAVRSVSYQHLSPEINGLSFKMYHRQIVETLLCRQEI